MASQLSGAELESIITQLAPTVTFRPLLRDQVDESLKYLLRFTEEQVRVLEGLRRARRAVVYGGAGTGKTVLASERARRLADEGFRVLLTCFNRPLGDHLRASISDDRITVASFHAFALGQVQRAGGFIPPAPGRSWWDLDLPSALSDAAETNGTEFDAIVVDEGQDFDATWWTVLSLLLADPEEGAFYVFADTQQAIYRSRWEPPFKGLDFDLTINCRNTLPIAKRVAEVFGGGAPSPTIGAEGPDPRIHLIDGFAAVGPVLRDALHRLLVKEHLRPDQVVILSTTKDVVDTARARRFGNHRVVAPGEDGVVAETVHRFKGLEADAILLVALQPGRESQSLLYIGMSRARAYLELICTPEVAATARWFD
jgi:superfamily I DNA/RNA helicase